MTEIDATREVAPRKERRAFLGWIVMALIVLVGAVAIATHVLGTHDQAVPADKAAQTN